MAVVVPRKTLQPETTGINSDLAHELLVLIFIIFSIRRYESEYLYILYMMNLLLCFAAVPEWFAAGAFGLVTAFTLLLRNVPALQSNLL